MFRKILFCVVVSSLVLVCKISAQNAAGKQKSPEEGREQLKQFAATYSDRGSWEKRADLIRKNIVKGLQLDPMPVKGDLKPIVHSRKEMNGYTVENVAIETMPGFWLTGNIYRPSASTQKLAGILCPHGHSSKPAEHRANADWQKRCASLAAMGAVVFAYDMIGFSESTQCEHKLATAARIQTWNGIRALDYLLSLPEVDASRIGMTGESGGGTQTFVLSAIDKRIAVCSPVVMVSSYFPGGCVCESGMPIHSGMIETNNAEIAALMAPRPMLIVSDGKDWTQHVPEIEFPYIKKIYDYYKADNKISNVHFPEGAHDYNFDKRKPVYAFFAKNLQLDLKAIQNVSGETDEAFVTVLPFSSLKVFDQAHPRPSYAVIGNEEVMHLFEKAATNSSNPK